MAFFTNLTCTLFSVAEETTNADGTPIYEIKAVTSPQGEAIPIILMVDQKTETGAFLKQLAELTKKKQAARVLITGVIQEAQDLGEIESSIKASDLAAFIEDAGKGAMVSMKEMKSAYPVDNFMNILTKVFLK